MVCVTSLRVMSDVNFAKKEEYTASMSKRDKASNDRKLTIF